LFERKGLTEVNTKMIDWLKENWFKIALAFLLVTYIALSRFSFLHIEGMLVAKCDKLTGLCSMVWLKKN